MNPEKSPKPPTLLLLTLLALCSGLLLLHTLDDNIANGGVKNLQQKNSQLEQAVEKTKQ